MTEINNTTHNVTRMENAQHRPKGTFQMLFHYVMGNAPFISEIFDGKPAIVQFPNMCFRAYGAPIFINNPFAGFLIFVATMLTPYNGIMGLVGLVSAILTSLITSQPMDDIIGGGCTFHGLLIGLTLAATSGKEDWYPWLVFPVFVLGAFSVYIANALGTLFSRVELPTLNLSFNLLTFLFLSATGTSHEFFPVAAGGGTSDWTGNISASEVLGAIPRSLSGIYGCDGWVPGFIVLVAMAVASPMLMVHAISGVLISISVAFALNIHPEIIYSGDMSYNALLSCASLAGFFLVPTPHSHIVAASSAFFSTLLTIAMRNYFSILKIPIVAFPFNISTMLLICVTSTGDSLRRVAAEHLTCPELHWVKYVKGSVHPII